MTMATSPRMPLRALSALLAYPDAELRDALPEIAAVFRCDTLLAGELRATLATLADEIGQSDPFEAEAAYVELFDRGRRTSLNLFEHVYGNSRNRGPAMLELQQRYRDAGLEPTPHELPDHLPLLLEYLSCRETPEIHALLAEIAPIVRRLGNALRRRDSRYSAVMEAVLMLGGQPGLDRDLPPDTPDDVDRDWEEQPAFSGDAEAQRSFTPPATPRVTSVPERHARSLP